ncbi:hypothetical protein [Streptomyces sp. NPDC002573]|uniref:hypothetical protein n=1 Tax=Streptomyces sp. NPDC002573 TaxID=3364651 RepID=UPI0036A5CC2E
MPGGGLAARVMGWQQRMRATAGPLGASGEASTGDPVTVELLVSGVWTDITPYVMVRDDQGRITLTRGIRDEGSQTEQASATLPLKNADGRFTPRNPMGVWYGQIGRNQPVRISVPDGMGGKSYRVWGEIPKWPPSWDPTGTDVWTDVAVNGLLQRLSQGPASARSVIYNAVTNPLPPSVVAYWPCEDPAGSTSLASALTTGSPMTWSGTPTLASYSSLAASDPLPDLTSATLSGGVAAYADPTATQVRFLLYVPVNGLADGKVICSIDQSDYSAGSPQFWELFYSTTEANNSLVLRTFADDGTFLGAELSHTLDVRGRLLYVSIELQESGTSITRALRLKDVNTGSVYTVNDTETLTQLTRVTRVQFGPASRSVVQPIGTQFLPGVAIGHCTVENAITDIAALGVRLNPIGETAGRRVQRLCGESGIPVDWIGDLDDTAAMGAQGKTNPLSLMRECADADGGMIYETRAVLGLGYRTRVSLYNQDPQLVLDYTGYNLSAVPTPVEDDRYLANRVVVSVGGVTATYEDTTSNLSTAQPPAGVGVYGPNSDSPLALNLGSSDTATLLDQAAWRVHLGTVDEPRYPQISVNLAHASFVNNPALRRAVLALRMGDRVQVINPPSWLGTDSIDQLILGFEEDITHFEHRITFVCAPASPYNTIGYLDTNARLDTDSSQLAEPVGTAATVLDVLTTSGPTWTSAASDFPFDVRAGGEVMTVSSISAQPFDRFDRTSASGWGTATSGDVWNEVQGVTADRTVSGNTGLSNGLGTINLGSTPTTIRFDLAAAGIADTSVLVSISPGQVPAGNSLAPGIIMRYQDPATFYRARLLFRQTSDGQTVALNITASGTDMGTYETGSTYAANDVWWIRAQVAGQTISARVWKDGTAEPTNWQLVATVTSSPIATGSVGVSASGAPGITTTNATVAYGGFAVSGPQTFVVTRSVNGVVKSHAAGESLSLAHPTIIAL